VSYGVGCDKNAYYEFPSWLPLFGVTVRSLPVTNFDINIENYNAYDKDRLPFVVDIKAFFRIDNTNVAASRVQSSEELKNQLLGIVQGTVRSVLAKAKLENIMEERSTYGEQFTSNVQENLKEWGIKSVRSIELMDVRDVASSNVIENIMAKKKSAIEKESRVEVAENTRIAAEAELVAAQKVKSQEAESERIKKEAFVNSEKSVMITQAMADKEKGVAAEHAKQMVQDQLKITKEKEMLVSQVENVKAAEIAKEAAIVMSEQEKEQIRIRAEAEQKKVQVTADAEKYQIENIAKAKLEAEKNRAEGIKAVGQNEAEVIKAKGLSEAEAEKAKQLASVTAQTTLAKEVGENDRYQSYLIKIKQIEASVEIGVQQAKSYGDALKSSDLKIIANAGDVNSGIGKITDLLSSKGGQAVNGLVESLQQTEVGADLVNHILGKLGGGGGENGSKR
jgi:flotillin